MRRASAPPLRTSEIRPSTALGWAAVGLMSAGSPLNWQALCQPGMTGGIGELALAVPMWIAMTLAMMLPTAGPMILTYAEIADTAARKGEPVVSPLILTTGYVAVWLGFALAAALLQWALASAGLLDGGRDESLSAARSFSPPVSINSRRSSRLA